MNTDIVQTCVLYSLWAGSSLHRANCQPVRGRNPAIYTCIEECVDYWLICLEVPNILLNVSSP